MTELDTNTSLKIGLTGGIASGKTTVANLFADLGITVIDTDIIAREIVQPGEAALGHIRRRFGKSMISADGGLDRRAMRELIFSDDEARSGLESILHPRIGERVRIQSAAAAGPYHIIVVPLLVASPLRQFVDRILVVDCDEDTQIRRLTARDSETIDQARKILSAQSSRQERLSTADDVIDNDQDLDAVKARVLELHALYQQDR